MALPAQPFDFRAHRDTAVAGYLEVRPFYQSLADVVKRVVEEALRRQDIRVHSVQGRAKDAASFGNKAAQPAETDDNVPMYRDPLTEITDLAGVRIITFFPKTLTTIDGLLGAEFDILERSDKSAILMEEDRFGYQSIHYLVRLSEKRTRLPEYERYAGAVAEVQVRTILQHAWAEIEHDIQYKSSIVIPNEIRRRFMTLAGLLEIADREFQAIQDADSQLTVAARSRVSTGELQNVEITPDALKTFLDRNLGPDGRMRPYSYEWTARTLRLLGFRTLDQVNECIRAYDDDRLSRLITGGREGQLSRFEYMLLAGMGPKFIERHVFAQHEWFRERHEIILKKLPGLGVPVGNFDPVEGAQADVSPG